MSAISPPAPGGQRSVGEYTDDTREWLDARFRETTDDGVYLAHQAIYGFRAEHCDPAIVERYVVTHHILRALSLLEFDSLLDVGAAEGYKAALARDRFGARVECCDLSAEACRRAEEIYGVTARPADVHNLPYEDGAFDVVLCSETLEHVADFEKACGEVLRVASRAAVITVPHEAEHVVEGNVERGDPHAHIHEFDDKSFDNLRERHPVEVTRILSTILRYPSVLVEARPRPLEGATGLRRALLPAYNRSAAALRFVLREPVAIRIIAAILRWDQLLSRQPLPYGGVLAVVLKDPSCRLTTSRNTVRPMDLLSTTVPFHRLDHLTSPDAPQQR